MKLAFPETLPLDERLARYGEIQSLLDLAASGCLTVGDESFDPVVSQPDLWELRWSFSDGTEWRQYHAEPPTKPKNLLALLFHQKDLSGGELAVRSRQNAAMADAQARYRTGVGWDWGISDTRTGESVESLAGDP